MKTEPVIIFQLEFNCFLFSAHCLVIINNVMMNDNEKRGTTNHNSCKTLVTIDCTVYCKVTIKQALGRDSGMFIASSVLLAL